MMVAIAGVKEIPNSHEARDPALWTRLSLERAAAACINRRNDAILGLINFDELLIACKR